MFIIRRGADRGHFDHGWLNTYHTFSFAEYRDERFMGFSTLRVLNEDVVAAGQGFGMHPHQDMEIVTYVLSGTLEHRDSLGNGGTIQHGEMQRISAGTGIQHSEFNPSDTEPVHLYQIWLFPNQRGLKPSYEQRSVLATPDQVGKLRLVASPEGGERVMTIHQDARIYVGELNAGTDIDQPLSPGRSAWMQVMRGRIVVNDTPLETSDAIGVREESKYTLRAETGCEVMVFDLS